MKILTLNFVVLLQTMLIIKHCKIYKIKVLNEILLFEQTKCKLILNVLLLLNKLRKVLIKISKKQLFKTKSMFIIKTIFIF